MTHFKYSMLASVVATTLLLTPSFYASAHDPVEPAIKQAPQSDEKKTQPPLTQDDHRQILITFEKEQAANCKIDCKVNRHHSIEITHDDEDNDEDDDIDFRFESNPRDGFYLGLSAISSFGDDFRYPSDDEPSSQFDIDLSYRVQLLGFFIESPSLSTRRMHGMYSLPAWGFNVINTDTWSFDVFYQRNNKGIEGLEGLQIRNLDKRGGLRATGYFDNSQLELIYSPFSRNNVGSDGVEASVSYSYNGQFKNWSYYANLGMQYRSREVLPQPSDLVQYDSRSGLSKNDGLSRAAEIGFEYPITTDWVFGTFVSYNKVSNRTIIERPQLANDGVRAGMLLSFVF